MLYLEIGFYVVNVCPHLHIHTDGRQEAGIYHRILLQPPPCDHYKMPASLMNCL